MNIDALRSTLELFPSLKNIVHDIFEKDFDDVTGEDFDILLQKTAQSASNFINLRFLLAKGLTLLRRESLFEDEISGKLVLGEQLFEQLQKERSLS